VQAAKNQGDEVKNQLLISLMILFSAAVESVLAQQDYSFLTFEEVYLTSPIMEGAAPPLATRINAYSSEITYSPELNRVFLLDNETLFEIDLSTRQWYTTELGPIPTVESRLGYSAYHNSLLFWDGGVGRVFQLDSTGSFNRLDNSFNHRSQYGHLAWLEPGTGAIYALGGYGLFEDKTHLVRLNTTSGTWELVDPIDPLRIPGILNGRTGVYDYTNQVVYVITNALTVEEHNTGKGNPNLAAIWKYSIATRTWDRLHLYDTPVTSGIHNSRDLLIYTKHPRLPIFIFPIHPNNVTGYPICTFHTENHYLHCFEKTPLNQLNNPRIISFFWSERDQAYYYIGLQVQSAAQRNLVQIIKMTITDEQAFMQWLERGEQPWYRASGLWITVGVLFIGLVLFGVYYHRRFNGVSDSPVVCQDHIITIIHTENGAFSLVGQGSTFDGIPDIEQKMLAMLVDTCQYPDTYLKSDDIDMALLPDHPSQDYIRRLRNLTLERLEGLLQSVGDPSVNYILRRSSLADKRKNEYRLNDNYVRIG